MTTDYNQGHIAEQYKKAKEQPWRARIETYSLMKRIGDLTGKKVIDIACGEGFFTRKLLQAGAATVVGVDIAERMIELARAQEVAAPLGIEYRVEDARALVPQQAFDLAVSAWLLVYAHDRAELADMCRGLARRLRSGGRFVTFTTNPGLYHFKVPDYGKYGFGVKLADKVAEGAPITWLIQQDGPPLEIENYYIPLSAYESAFRDAGFTSFSVHQPELAPDPQAGDDRTFWADFLDYPPAIVLECVKK
ncbi:MAG: class I SAM-dependent methyltransferase [Planctomycetes bacterium]|nr:class I SAM-dependent methyltransferase [Planctomycetota bacterium]